MEALTILICAHGESEWRDLAYSRAFPSAAEQALTLVHYEPDATLAETRNAAAEGAETEWLCFLDADDELDFGYVDAMARGNAAGSGIDALYAPAVKYVDARRATAPPAIPNGGGDMERVNSCVVGTLIRRTTFLLHGGFSEWPLWEDWDLFLGVHLSGVPICYVPDAVYRAHVKRQGRNAPGDRRLAERTYRAIRAKHGLAAA